MSGPPSEALIRIQDNDELNLLLSEWILDELFRNLQKLPEDKKKHAIESLKYLQEAEILREEDWKGDLDEAKEKVKEEKDAPVMAAFLSEADYLVTSNIKDFPFSENKDILNPKELLKKNFSSTD